MACNQLPVTSYQLHVVACNQLPVTSYQLPVITVVGGTRRIYQGMFGCAVCEKFI